MANKIISSKATFTVVLISLLIAIALGVALWDINFWPTDTRVYYFDAAVRLPFYNHLSEIHKTVDDVKIRWLHGKEIFILCASAMQWVINDFETLRPFICVNIIAIFFSSILIFVIARDLWGAVIGLICYFVFSTSIWSYLYILFAKHQPLGLVFFLFAFYILKFGNERKFGKVNLFISGMSMGLSFFSSTVSALYVPYYFAGFIYYLLKDKQNQSIRNLFKPALLQSLSIVSGIAAVIIYINYPDVVHNIKSFIEYVQISGSHNHFYYNQPYLKQWFMNTDVELVRGGWLWILKYFFVIMPVLFPFYIWNVLCLFVLCFRKTTARFRWVTLLLLILSFSSPIMAEIAGVAQYGANYFPAIIGVIFLIGYGCYRLMQTAWLKNAKMLLKVTIGILGLGVATAHAWINTSLFINDVYPTRMATTFLSRKINELAPQKIYTHFLHPHRNHFVLFVNPETYNSVRFVPIDFVIQPSRDYILIPPVTGESIYIASMSTYSDFEDDVFLNELVRQEKLEKFAVASYKTIASSEIWLHEEEILSYRKLILNHKIPDDDIKTRVWLLDSKMVHKYKDFIVPVKEYLDLYHNGLRNVGTKRKTYIYEGYNGKILKPTELRNLVARVSKIGDPKDSLIAYVFRVHEVQTVWVPFNEHYISQPLPGEKVIANSEEGIGVFKFDPPLNLNKGSYFFMIYRTGEPDDQNYYQVKNGYIATL